MPIDVSLHDDQNTAIIRGYEHINEDEMRQMRAEFRGLADEHSIKRALVDARDVISLMGGQTLYIFQTGAAYGDLGNSKSLRTAIVLPGDPQAKTDLKFMLTVEANRGRYATEFFDTMDEAWTWLLDDAAPPLSYVD
jgi:hypothetical protein